MGKTSVAKLPEKLLCGEEPAHSFLKCEIFFMFMGLFQEMGFAMHVEGFSSMEEEVDGLLDNSGRNGRISIIAGEDRIEMMQYGLGY